MAWNSPQIFETNFIINFFESTINSKIDFHRCEGNETPMRFFQNDFFKTMNTISREKNDPNDLRFKNSLQLPLYLQKYRHFF